MINEQDYIKTEKDDGTIIFTPKKKIMTRSDGWKHGEYFYKIWGDGTINNLDYDNDSHFRYGNYYHTEEQAQAVADLRRHVYKFPAVNTKEGYLSYNKGVRNTNRGDREYSYFRDWLPITATKEEQEERTRLIKRCYELNGYVSI